MNEINIVFICDKNYVIPTKTAINSIIINSNAENVYNIFIIAVDLNKEEIKIPNNILKENIKIQVISVENQYKNIGQEQKYLHVSKAALCKFDIPKVLSNLDKVLYLDSDIIVLSDLVQFYNTDIKDSYAAVVKDMAAILEFKRDKNYFNSGVMLLNLKNMRKRDISSRLLKCKIKDKYNVFMDQDAFNKAFNNKVKYISPNYNLMCSNLNYDFEKIAKFYNCDIEIIKQIMEKPEILHLTSHKKPWNDTSVIKSEIWYNYFDIKDIYFCLKNYFDNVNKNQKEILNKIDELNIRIDRLEFDSNHLVRTSIKNILKLVLKENYRPFIDIIRKII